MVSHTYIQVQLILDAVHQDIAIFVLGEIGFESFEQEQHYLNAYITAEVWNEAVLQESFSQYPILQESTYTVTQIEPTNWNAVWEAHFNPIEIEPHILIRANHHSTEKDAQFRFVIQIQPKMAFGTGHHETTRMMLTKMLEYDFAGKTVLDMGCGSGILAILASKLNAQKIVAIDIDTWSVENTLEHLELNHTPNVEVLLGEVKAIPNTLFEIILANINRNIILEDASKYVQHLASKGILMVSGFLQEDIPKIQDCLTTLGLQQIGESEENNWVCLSFQKS